MFLSLALNSLPSQNVGNAIASTQKASNRVENEIVYTQWASNHVGNEIVYTQWPSNHVGNGIVSTQWASNRVGNGISVGNGLPIALEVEFARPATISNVLERLICMQVNTCNV